jgi:hypothetical protein
MFGLGNRSEKDRAGEDLDRAIAACRASNDPAMGLSAAARGTILRAAHDDSARSGAFAPLFFPVRLVIAAGLVPAILVTAGVLLSVPKMNDAARPGGQGVQVAKLGDEVVFTFANGKRSHVVTKSTAPDRFDRSKAIQVRDNRFVDSATAGPNLVFYRID